MIRTLCNECGTDEGTVSVLVSFTRPITPSGAYLGKAENHRGDLCEYCLKIMLAVLAPADQGIRRVAG